MKNRVCSDSRSAIAPAGETVRVKPGCYTVNLELDSIGHAERQLRIVKKEGDWVLTDTLFPSWCQVFPTLKEARQQATSIVESLRDHKTEDEEEELTALDAPCSESSHDERISEAVAAQYEAKTDSNLLYDDDSKVMIWVDASKHNPPKSGLYWCQTSSPTWSREVRWHASTQQWDEVYWAGREQLIELWGHETVVGQIASIPPLNN